MPENIYKIQKKIINLYRETFKNYNQELGLSVPHIPRISKDYFKNRTIILGQETNTWFRTTNNDLQQIFTQNLDKPIKICLTNRYDKFIKDSLSPGKYGGSFWKFNRMLYDKQILPGKMISNSNLSHCWMNLFVVEACNKKNDANGRPTKNKNLAKDIIEIQGDLVFKIFKMLKPRLIISLTGHSLDPILLKTALGITTENQYKIKAIDPINLLAPERLAEIIITDLKNPLRVTKIIRCYHPTYFMGRINAEKQLNINFSNSEYYLKTLLNKIKTNIVKITKLYKGVSSPRMFT